MKYLKKLLDELENIMDQVETELQRRVEETPGERKTSSTVYSLYFIRHHLLFHQVGPIEIFGPGTTHIQKRQNQKGIQ